MEDKSNEQPTVVASETSTPASIGRSQVAPSSTSQRKTLNARSMMSEDAREDVENLSRSVNKRGSVTGIVNNWVSNHRKSTVKKKTHYRRGTVVLEHLQNKIEKDPSNEKDKALLDTLTAAYEKNQINAKTMLGISIFSDFEEPINDPFSVSNMPLDIQIGFHRKLYALFAMQLAITTALMAVLQYTPLSDSILTPVFEGSYVAAILAFVAVIVSLLLLYLAKYNYPLNYVSLAVFTLVESYAFSGISKVFETHVSVFISSYLTLVMVGMGIMTTITSVNKYDERVTMSHTNAGFLSFMFVLCWSLLWHGATAVLSNGMFALCIVFNLVLVLWFAYDAACMCKKMSPDEYMQGLIFFYSDMVLFLIFLIVIGVALTACEGETGGCTNCIGCGGGEGIAGVADAGVGGAEAGTADGATGMAYALSRADAAYVTTGVNRDGFEHADGIV